MRKPDRPEIELGPPREFIVAARGAMGGIDFDPWSTSKFNSAYVCARRYNDREILDLDEIVHGPWNVPIEGRTVMGLAAGAQPTRQLMGRLLKEYRKGYVKEACLITSHQEVCRTAPWIWDFPIVIPFRRLGYQYWDEELEEVRPARSAQWNLILYFPPVEIAEEFHNGIFRFLRAFSPLGRPIFSEYSGDRRWREHYKTNMKRSYNEML